MSAELVMRTVGVLACATTLSLLTTIAAYAAVNCAPLKWDGSFCAPRSCGVGVALTRDTSRARMRVAKLPGEPS